MSTNLPLPAAGGQLGRLSRQQDDDREGRAARRLAKLGYSETPAGARARMYRWREEGQRIYGAFIAEGCDTELDLFVAPLNEMQIAGLEIDLDISAKLTIEAADANDNPSRLKYWMMPTLQHARAVIRDARKTICTQYELIRGLRTKHRELAQ